LPSAGDQAVDDLRVLLAATGTRPPFVLVGNGYGGLLMRLYASRYPREVTGLVLLDSDDERLASRFQELAPVDRQESYRRWLREDPDGRAIGVTFAALRAAGPLPEVPRDVLSHGPPLDTAEQDVYRGLAGQAPLGRHVSTDQSGAREIPRMQPELVVEEVSSLVHTLRASGSSPLVPLVVALVVVVGAVVLVLGAAGSQRRARPRP
jgi:pimeloyl-ACP methyl ester carboxylesterase